MGESQTRGAASAPSPDEVLSSSSLDSAAEEEQIAAELRRNNPADRIASLNNIIHRQNITILELRRKIERIENVHAATQQSSVASTSAMHPSTSNSTPNDAKVHTREKIPPIIIMEEDSVIPEITLAHLEKLPNKFTMKKGTKYTKVLVNSIKGFDETKRFLSSNAKKFYSYMPKCENL
ncbi:unnamed protein product [Hermetia illucens]|uniref:Uncharacterized protein n=1 Tax=Hermetia illucens TaxID=343691 RepID=A0A7R8UXQ6_HERIL|nr:unnamed protein product [Hermetia illucens]